MAEAPSTAGLADSATETSAWEGARDALSGRSTDSQPDDSPESNEQDDPASTSSPPRSLPPEFTHPKKRGASDQDTSPDSETHQPSIQADAGEQSGEPDKNTSPRSYPAEVATSRAPGTTRGPSNTKSPAVETRDASADGGPSATTQIRDGFARLVSGAGYRTRRARYYFWRVLGFVMLAVKYAVLLALLVALVGGVLWVVAPAALPAELNDIQPL